MDNVEPSGADRRPTVRFGPDRRLAGLILAVAVIFAGLATVTSDVTGRLLYSLAAVLVAGVGVTDLIINPRLVLDGHGLSYRTGLTWHRLVWGDVESIALDERHRRGLTARTIEIDFRPDGDPPDPDDPARTDTMLVVLGRHALGTDPHNVKAVLDSFRPPSHGTP